jgi:hypothetical protein
MPLRIVNQRQFEEALAKNRTAFRAGAEKALNQSGLKMLDLMAQRLNGGGKVQSRTGRLRDSFDYVIGEKGDNLMLKIYSAGVPYAEVQELGTKVTGPIRPRNSKYLTIPLDDAKTGMGIARGSARSFRDTFVLNLGTRSNTPSDMRGVGSMFIVQESRQGLKWLFMLRKRVELPGGLGFFYTWITRGRPDLQKRMRRVLREVLGKKKTMPPSGKA